MTNPVFLAPVSESDPCGPDLRWDPDFLALNDSFTSAVAQGDAAVVAGQTLAGTEQPFDAVIDMAEKLCRRTKDLRVHVIHAEACWHHLGLPGFADAMEGLAAVQEIWPEPETGVHPRADEFDGDLGERAAAVGRLLNRIPMLVATLSWGDGVSDAEMVTAATTLRGVFASWNSRFEAAFGRDVPSARDAWQALSGLVGNVAPTGQQGDDGDEESDIGPVVIPRQVVDAWDLIDQALERMVEQDHHSPALPVLRLLSSWRAKGIIDIVDGMKPSGVTLEQLMESVKRQTQPK